MSEDPHLPKEPDGEFHTRDPHPGGRPTKYKEEYAEQARKLCLLGATDDKLADFFEVAVSTINNWKIDHPEFLESIRAGKHIADMEVADSAYKSCFDRTVEVLIPMKVKINGYGEKIEIVKATQFVQGSDRMKEFWLSARAREQFSKKNELVVPAGMSITISQGDGNEPIKD